MLKETAQKDLLAVNPFYQRTIISNLKGLSVNPYPEDVELMARSGVFLYYRIYRGPYAIHYRVDEESNLVEILAINRLT